jgi:hypothetical protein
MRNLEHARRRLRVIRNARVLSRLAAVTAAVVMGGMLPLPANAQSTTAHIFGQAPAGETVLAESSTGLHRHATVDAKGRYNLRNLPMSTYTVSLQKDGKVVDTRANIPVMVGRGAEVDFACPADHCAVTTGG